MSKFILKTINTISEKDILQGLITEITPKEAVINIGYKSEGTIPLSELKYIEDLKVGDSVDILIEEREDKQGQLILSHKKARTVKAWEKINDIYEKGEVFKGLVTSRTKGGLIVEVWGIDTFLPGSQIDLKPIKDYDVFVQKTMEFKVIKINKEFNNIVVSHKVLVEEGLESQRQEIIANLEKGQVLEGVVKNITDYGVFVDLGGVDGLIHITDLSWGRVNHPSEIVELESQINVVVLDFDYSENKKRIALGIKQLQDHPWEGLDQKVKEGDILEGTVVVVADYGVFVEIKHGVEGLLHVSEMSWSQYPDAKAVYSVGEKIKVMIQRLDHEEKKMSLSVKRLTTDPWENIEEKYPIGSKVHGTVINYTNYGVFVRLEEGVDGLIYISDLSWLKKIKHPSEVVKLGQEIEVVALSIDKENRKFSLSLKHMEENPWLALAETFSEGTIHTGTVTDSDEKGGIVLLPYGIEGFVPKKHLFDEDGKVLENEMEKEFKVIEFSAENKKLILSHTQIHREKQRKEETEHKKQVTKKAIETKKTVRKVQKSVEKTTLGDLKAFSDLKTELTVPTSQKKEKAKAAPNPVEKKEEKIPPKEKKTTQKKEVEETIKKDEKKEEVKEKKATATKKAPTSSKKEITEKEKPVAKKTAVSKKEKK